MSIMSATFLEHFSYFGRVQLFLRRWLRKKLIPTTMFKIPPHKPITKKTLELGKVVSGLF